MDASIGAALCPDDGVDAEALLQRADVAMYQAKEARTGFQAYDPSRDRHSRERLSLMAELRRALERDELILHYQPKVDLATGLRRRRRGARALAAPGPRPARPGRVPPARRAHRADAPADPARARDRALAARRLARRRARPRTSPSTSPSRTCSTCAPPGRSADLLDRHGLPAVGADARGHRAPDAARPAARGRGAGRPQGSSASASRSTTSAPATPRSSTSSGCRSTSSRSTSRS